MDEKQLIRVQRKGEADLARGALAYMVAIIAAGLAALSALFGDWEAAPWLAGFGLIAWTCAGC